MVVWVMLLMFNGYDEGVIVWVVIWFVVMSCVYEVMVSKYVDVCEVIMMSFLNKKSSFFK